MSARPKPDWPRALVAWASVWLFLLGSALPVAVLTLGRADPEAVNTDLTLVAFGVTGLAVLASVGWGFALGRRGRRRQLGLSVPAGSAALLIGYVISMFISADPNDPRTDNAAGAGLVILAVPVLLVVAMLVGIGALPAAAGMLRRRWLLARK